MNIEVEENGNGERASKQRQWQLKVSGTKDTRERLSPALTSKQQAQDWAFFITVCFLGYYAEVIEFIPPI